MSSFKESIRSRNLLGAFEISLLDLSYIELLLFPSIFPGFFLSLLSFPIDLKLLLDISDSTLFTAPTNLVFLLFADSFMSLLSFESTDPFLYESGTLN